MKTLEDRIVDLIIDCIVAFRVRYGYGRKLDDPELHEQLVTLLRQYATEVALPAEKERHELYQDGPA